MNVLYKQDFDTDQSSKMCFNFFRLLNSSYGFQWLTYSDHVIN